MTHHGAKKDQVGIEESDKGSMESLRGREARGLRLPAVKKQTERWGEGAKVALLIKNRTFRVASPRSSASPTG